MKRNLNGHTVFSADRAKWLTALLIGCLILTISFAISSSQAKRLSVEQSAVSTESIPAESFPPAKSIPEDASAELGGDYEQETTGTFAERPGKPDEHNSNGDDVLVRPVR